MRLPALKNQRKSNEPSPFGRDGLLAEARFKDLLLFFHSLPAPPAVRACPRTRTGEDLKIFDSFFRKTSSNMVLFKLRFRQAQPPFIPIAQEHRKNETSTGLGGEALG